MWRKRRLSYNYQKCKSSVEITEGNIKHWPKRLIWSHPFFIDHRTPTRPMDSLLLNHYLDQQIFLRCWEMVSSRLAKSSCNCCRSALTAALTRSSASRFISSKLICSRDTSATCCCSRLMCSAIAASTISDSSFTFMLTTTSIYLSQKNTPVQLQ